MSQVFDALRRSGKQLPGFEAILELSKDFDAADLDDLPSVRVEPLPEHRLVALSQERSAGAERIRMLGVRLRRWQQQNDLKTLLITGSIKDEGKSVLSANLGVSLAKTQQRVLLIDGDCHHGSLAQLFGASRFPGLTTWWRSEDSILKYIRRVQGLPLWFLPAGEPLGPAVEMLQSARLADMLSRASGCFDWIIVDSPPFAPLADAALWVSLTEGTLLVVRIGKTPKRMLAQVLDSVEQKKLLGVVLNDCEDPHLSYYAQYYKGNADELAQRVRG